MNLKSQSLLQFDGKEPSLGALFFSSIEVRAMGPDAFPFGSKAFGIRPLFVHQERFASSLFFPNIWFEAFLSESDRNRLELDLKWYGINSLNQNLYFSFFIKADSAYCSDFLISKKSLQRYSGKYFPIIFDSHVKFLTEGISKMELIPLSGDDSFWQSDYLVAFEIASSQSKFIFTS